MNIMEIQNVQYAYDGKKKVLKGINAQMELGKMYAILGPSGCGKTTLLPLLGGLDSPCSGQILYQGKDCKNSLSLPKFHITAPGLFPCRDGSLHKRTLLLQTRLLPFCQSIPVAIPYNRNHPF